MSEEHRAMGRHEKRHSISREPGASWTLIFDVLENSWMVEYWPRDPKTHIAKSEDRRRVPLIKFEASVDGKRLRAQTQAAITRAALDV